MWRKVDTPFWQRDPYWLSTESWGIVYAIHGVAGMALVTMIITTNVGRFPTTAVVKVWIASGTGPVRSGETLEAGGNTQLASTSELLSFTRGGGRSDGS